MYGNFQHEKKEKKIVWIFIYFLEGVYHVFVFLKFFFSYLCTYCTVQK